MRIIFLSYHEVSSGFSKKNSAFFDQSYGCLEKNYGKTIIIPTIYNAHGEKINPNRYREIFLEETKTKSRNFRTQQRPWNFGLLLVFLTHILIKKCQFQLFHSWNKKSRFMECLLLSVFVFKRFECFVIIRK